MKYIPKIIVTLALILASGCRGKSRVATADEDGTGTSVVDCTANCETDNPLLGLSVNFDLSSGVSGTEFVRGESFSVKLTVDLPPENLLGDIFILTNTLQNCDADGVADLASINQFPVIGGDSYVTIDTTLITAGTIRVCSRLSYNSFSRYDEIASAVSVRENIYLSKGYVPRACGFDTNGDGKIGFAADCNVCDGQTTNIDDDPENEDMWYVDKDNGSNFVGCGAPSTPCASIGYALSQLDGPSTGTEDIICISGVFDETLDLTQSGQPGFDTVNGFQIPQNPFMIVGWDKDNDGEYPPYDTDDIAVLDSGDTKDLVIDGSNESYVEIAHLTIRNYGGGWNRTYFINETNPGNSHIYLHDIHFENINDGGYNGSLFYVYDDQSSPNGGDGQNSVTHVLIENNNLLNIGTSMIALEADVPGEIQYVRANNNTYVPRGSLNSTWHSAIHLTAASDVEVFANHFNSSSYDLWTPEKAVVMNVGNCSKRVYLRDNIATDYAELFNGFLDDYVCRSTSIDDIYILRNQISIKNHTENGAVINLGYRTPDCKANTNGPCNIITNVFEDIFIAGNYVHKTATAAKRFALSSTIANVAGVNPGQLHIVGNTFVGMGLTFYSNDTYNQENYAISHNIFTGFAPTDDALGFFLTPSGYTGSYNIFDGTMGLVWGGVPSTDLADFKGDTLTENSSIDHNTCSPSFANITGFDFHLAASDTCARGFGGDISAFLATDIDGDTTQNPANAGADQ